MKLHYMLAHITLVAECAATLRTLVGLDVAVNDINVLAQVPTFPKFLCALGTGVGFPLLVYVSFVHIQRPLF